MHPSQAAPCHRGAWAQGAPSWAAGTFLTLPEVQEQFKHIPMDERHQQNTWTLPRALQKAEHTNKHIVADLRRHRSTHQDHCTGRQRAQKAAGSWTVAHEASIALPMTICLDACRAVQAALLTPDVTQ